MLLRVMKGIQSINSGVYFFCKNIPLQLIWYKMGEAILVLRKTLSYYRLALLAINNDDR